MGGGSRGLVGRVGVARDVHAVVVVVLLVVHLHLEQPHLVAGGRQQDGHLARAADREARGRHVLHLAARVIAERVTAELVGGVGGRGLADPARGQPVRGTAAAQPADGQLHEQREPGPELVHSLGEHGHVVGRVELHVVDGLLDAVARVVRGGAADGHLARVAVRHQLVEPEIVGAPGPATARQQLVVGQIDHVDARASRASAPGRLAQRSRVVHRGHLVEKRLGLREHVHQVGLERGELPGERVAARRRHDQLVLVQARVVPEHRPPLAAAAVVRALQVAVHEVLAHPVQLVVGRLGAGLAQLVDVLGQHVELLLGRVQHRGRVAAARRVVFVQLDHHAVQPLEEQLVPGQRLLDDDLHLVALHQEPVSRPQGPLDAALRQAQALVLGVRHARHLDQLEQYPVGHLRQLLHHQLLHVGVTRLDRQPDLLDPLVGQVPLQELFHALRQYAVDEQLQQVGGHHLRVRRTVRAQLQFHFHQRHVLPRLQYVLHRLVQVVQQRQQLIVLERQIVHVVPARVALLQPDCHYFHTAVVVLNGHVHITEIHRHVYAQHATLLLEHFRQFNGPAQKYTQRKYL